MQDADGKSVGGARVCYVDAGGDIQRCGMTDEAGRFDLPSMKLDTLKIVADDFLVAMVSANDLEHPVVLVHAPSLLVHLVDAQTGEPIASGDVYVSYPSGKEKGPFPVNRAGVRVRRVIEPGKVRLRVEAPGYASGRPREVELVAGKETEVDLRLKPESKPEPESGKPDS